MALHTRDSWSIPVRASRTQTEEPAPEKTGLTESIGLISRRWPILVAALALGVIGAGLVSMLVRPQYHSSTRVLVGTCAEGSIEQAYQCGLFTKDRALSYASLVTSDLLAQRVIGDLRLDRSPNEVASKITATAEPETALIEIIVTDEDAATARLMADSAARQFVQMVAEVELRNSGQRDNPFTNLTVVEAAKEASQTGSTTEMNLLFGAVGGLVIGLIAAIIRDRLDTKVHGAEQVSAAGLTPLGEVPVDAGNGEWVDHGDPRVEGFRRLRVVLRGFGQVMVVTGPHAGVGACEAAIDLARANAEAGAKVLLVNADMHGEGPALGRFSTHPGLAEMLSGDMSEQWLTNCVTTWNHPSISVLGPGMVPESSSATALLASGRFGRVLEMLRQEFDLVIVYAAPVLDSADATVVGSASDAVVLVARADTTTATDLTAGADALRASGATVLGALLTTSAPARSARQEV